ncbi:hypothetical protein niasHT_013250 [Heterodera trifolii]|uniref:CCHC-type domain-containing protein n=1 Tax=Heterodera trifolii TaxID=157864 RepID=A0ABD2LLC0_9BILA
MFIIVLPSDPIFNQYYYLCSPINICFIIGLLFVLRLLKDRTLATPVNTFEETADILQEYFTSSEYSKIRQERGVRNHQEWSNSRNFVDFELRTIQKCRRIHRPWKRFYSKLFKLLANQTNAAAAPQAVQNTVPSLPDVSIFEPSDDKGRINEWLSRFKFALDCAAPNAPDDIKLEKLFSKPQSVFIDRYECLKAARAEGEEFRPFINRHKRLLADFRFDELKKEQFNCLMLLTALKLATDGDNVSYDAVVEDLINFQSTIAEARAIEVPTSSKYLNVVRQKGKQTNYADKRSQAKQKTNMPNSTKCWRCGGEQHRPNECWHKTAKCQKCKFDGHIEKQCAAFHEWRKQNAKKWKNNKRVFPLSKCAPRQ